MEEDKIEIKLSLSNLKKAFKKDTKWFLLTVFIFGFGVYAYFFPSVTDGQSSEKSSEPSIEKPTIFKVGEVVGYQVEIKESKKYKVAVTNNNCHHIILQRQNQKEVVLAFDGKANQEKEAYLKEGKYMFSLFPNGNKTTKAAIDIQPAE